MVNLFVVRMVECPVCESDHSHSELELVESYSTKTSTYAFLKCPSCGTASDYSTWDAFNHLYD